jgi:hypothetical protein
VRHVQLVGEEELQRVSARRKHHRRLGLSTAEMHMDGVRRDRQIQRRRGRIYEQMMVTRVGFYDASWSNTGARETEHYAHWARDCLTIAW